ncbi:hypothetical protein SprV_0401595900 [Sparganum proliferum]
MQQTGIPIICTMMRQLQLRRSRYLGRIDDKRLPKQLLCRNVVTAARDKYIKPTAKRHIEYLFEEVANPSEDMERPLAEPSGQEKNSEDWSARLWSQSDFSYQSQKEGLQVSDASDPQQKPQPLPMCPRCLQTFHIRVDLVGHLRTPCTNAPEAPTAALSATRVLTADAQNPCAPPFSFTAISIITVTTSVVTNTTTKVLKYATGQSDRKDPSSTNLIANTPTTSDVHLVITCFHFKRTLTSRIGLVDNWQIHRTANEELVPGTPHRLAASAFTAHGH